MKNTRFLIIFFSFSTFLFSQKKKIIDVDDFIEETQFSNGDDNVVEMIWWIPKEYWELVFSKEQSVSDEETKQIVELLEDYAVVLAVKGKVGLFGGITYKSREEIISTFKIHYNGNLLKHINTEDIDPDLQNFLGFIKPMMKNMLGQMGENMHIYVFKNDKKHELSAFKKGNLSFDLAEFNAQLDLPLSCLLEEKVCPDDKKEFNGKWNFCPFHGNELLSK